VTTPINLAGLVRPHVVEMTKREDVPFAAEFRLQPLERGYGHTLGNALRRMLLSSLPGAAVWGFKLDGVLHEHQTIPGVVEDIHQVIQRLKALTLVLEEGKREAVLSIKATKAGPVLARHIQPNASVRVVHPDHLLFTLQEDRDISGELHVNAGRGYVEASQQEPDKTPGPDFVRIDAVYNPVRRANFTIQETRVGQRTDFDSLTLAVETNGAMQPEDAVAYAAALLQEHVRFFLDFGRLPTVAMPEAAQPPVTRDSVQLRDLLAKSIDECGLSVRSINSLKNAKISTLGDLVVFTQDQLLKFKNVGGKALEEIAEMLRSQDLNLGMKFEDRDGRLVVVDPGTPPVVPKDGEHVEAGEGV
jgi:DNA-directed RNA polymerase subunit alpha